MWEAFLPAQHFGICEASIALEILHQLFPHGRHGAFGAPASQAAASMELSSFRWSTHLLLKLLQDHSETGGRTPSSRQPPTWIHVAWLVTEGLVPIRNLGSGFADHKGVMEPRFYG